MSLMDRITGGNSDCKSDAEGWQLQIDTSHLERDGDKSGGAWAGIYQIKSGTSDWSYYSSYFDDPRDQVMIDPGYQIFNNLGGYSGQ